MLVHSCSAFKPYGIIFHVKPSIDRTLEKKYKTKNSKNYITCYIIQLIHLHHILEKKVDSSFKSK